MLLLLLQWLMPKVPPNVSTAVIRTETQDSLFHTLTASTRTSALRTPGTILGETACQDGYVETALLWTIVNQTL